MSRRLSRSPQSARSVVAAAALALSGALAGGIAGASGAPAATTAPPPSSPPPGSTRIATIAPTTEDPRISADGDVAAWSSGSQITVSSGGQLLHFSTGGLEPRGVTVGHVDGAAPIVLFSLCPRGKHASTSRRGSCDLFRISSLDAYGTVVKLTTLGAGTKVAGVNTTSGDEMSPALTGHFLVFARWRKGPVPGQLVRHDLTTGREALLPDAEYGTCRQHRNCSWDQSGAAGPVEVAASGNTYAEQWVFLTADISFDPTSAVHVGNLTGKAHDHVTTSTYVDGGSGNEDDEHGIQLVDGTTVQAVDHQDPGEDDAGEPGSLDFVERTPDGKHYATYSDPAGRRTVGAASTPTALWLILSASAVPAGDVGINAPAFCAASVGGCVVERLPLPTFNEH